MHPIKSILKYHLIVGLILGLTGCKTNPPSVDLTPPAEYGKVYIVSNVDSCLIFVDNLNTKKYTPAILTLAVGNHQIRLEKENYTSETKNVTIIKDSLILFNFTLKLLLADKITLIEDFANVSCGPCVISNRILESIKANYGHKKVVIIKFPTNFPSPSDPFYLANKSDCNSRMSYYNILVAPTTKIDGILTPVSTDSNAVKQKIEQRISQIPKFKLTVRDSLSLADYNINIILEIIDTTGVDFTNLVLHTVVVESLIEFATPPGSNGETKFYDVMRKMLPSSSGESLNYYSSTQTYERQINLNPIWNPSKLETVVFIQNKATKEVLQAGSTYTFNQK